MLSAAEAPSRIAGELCCSASEGDHERHGLQPPRLALSVLATIKLDRRGLVDLLRMR
jgi:hypothetical protein